MPFLYPIRSTEFPFLILADQTHDEDDESEDDYPTTIFSRTIPIPMIPQSHVIHTHEQTPPSTPVSDDGQDAFRLRMNVDGFQANELDISIRHGQLIVRGKHVVRSLSQSSQPLTTNSIISNENDDTEPDFVAKEFKRTFPIPPNTDVRKAHAQFYPQQQVLVIEIPLENSARLSRTRIRPIDVFLTIITILLMDRALRITYEHFMMNEEQQPTSQDRNRRRRENRQSFF